MPAFSFIPRQHRKLFKELRISDEGFITSGGIALRKAGGVLQIRPSMLPLKKRSAKITIAHEYGHQVWDFVLTDAQRRQFIETHQKLLPKVEREIAEYEKESRVPWRSWLMHKHLGGEIPEESFAELYGLYYGVSKERAEWEKGKPEMYSVFKEVVKV